MVVTTTSAAALAAGSVLADIEPVDRPGALVLLTLLAGAVMIAAGLLRLGRYTRFVSHSVMIGFLTGVAANIVLGQLPNLTGVAATGGTNLTKALDVLAHPGRFHVASLAVGAAALVILVALRRTRLARARAPPADTRTLDALSRLRAPLDAGLGLPSGCAGADAEVSGQEESIAVERQDDVTRDEVGKRKHQPVERGFDPARGERRA